jgi:hypothetical protein
MVEVTCINDKNRPKEIPANDWVVVGEKYHITHISIQVNQKENGGYVLGADLYEKPLSIEKHKPYECFRLVRFAINNENLQLLIELMEDCYNLPKIKIDELIKESELQIL